MKLLGLVLLIGWYAAAKRIHRKGDCALGWQTRCLNCQTTKPASKSDILQVQGRRTKVYSLANCEHCDKLAGAAIEPTESSTAI